MCVCVNILPLIRKQSTYAQCKQVRDVRRAQREKKDKHRCVSVPEGENNVEFMILNHKEEELFQSSSFSA